MAFNLFGDEAGSSSAVVPAAALGHVRAVTGAQASVRLPLPDAHAPHAARVTVGRFLGLRTATSLIIGVVTEIAAEGSRGAGPDDADHAVGRVDMLGEIKSDERRGPYFQRGVTDYPLIGDPAVAVGTRELKLVYDRSGGSPIVIGELQQDSSLPAYVNVDDMVRKHFAVLGTTGVGKSSGVALLMRQILDARPDLRVFLIDPHNEYGHSFGSRAQTLNPNNLKLPFWLFNFEETVDVFFRGRPGVEEEVEILSEVIPLAKSMLTTRPGERTTLRRHDPKSSGITVDTPVPYRLEDLVALIDERMGKLENRALAPKYHRLISRIELVRGDPRYSFMFDNANIGGDTMVEVLAQLFRLPPDGVPMTIMQLAGFPAEVVDSVVSVVCRMAFEFGLWSDGAFPLLVVCEESHRYAPADRSIGFGPTRKAVSRIAKEGRKYGVYLGLVTQRPAELDSTIISQCSTLFAMRMANDRDQAIVRSAVSDAAANLLTFVPSLGTREVFAFGEGVALPTRLRFSELPAHAIPHSESVGHGRMEGSQDVDRSFIASVVARWRGATMSGRSRRDDGLEDLERLATSEFSSLRRPPAESRGFAAAPAAGAPLQPESFYFPVDDGGLRRR